MGQTSYTLDRKIDVEPVSIETTASGSFVLRNQYLQAIFDDKGHLINLFDRAQERELVPEGRRGNVFQLYEDIGHSIENGSVQVGQNIIPRDALCIFITDFLTARSTYFYIQILEEGPLRASLRVTKQITENSSVTQVIVLTAVSKRIDFETEAEWHENRQFLATYEIQFGALTRPTHYNTTLDSAKFEVCGHKFADLSEASYGVALLNDCKYGYATHDNVQRLSLLRAPKVCYQDCPCIVAFR
ncbi:galactose mutarotase-like domain-containing protein [Jimgerdemannia flammicorona]|uniref:Galactose mutarotase-like domain-containing protein n=1 Tax=Jimgerdemannia flammicorona TaxID=994334 RepID=A0A433DEY5_9FUNG|nr:galactose mutarotase-like domain-containing protein [Jimgerdemannia flammicorona]